MRKAFTLIELLIVVAILAILAAILLPTLQSARRHSLGVVCLSNEHQIGQAVAMYCGDNDDRYPLGAYNSAVPGYSPQWDVTWRDLLNPYVRGTQGVFICPVGAAGSYSYGCNPYLSGYYQAASQEEIVDGFRVWGADHNTANWPIAPLNDALDPQHNYLTDRHQGRVNALFTDGHAAAVTRDYLLGTPGLWQPAPGR